MDSIPEIDASTTVDSKEKNKHVCLKEQKEQHNLDRSQTHPKQLVQREHPCRISSEPSLNPETFVVQENSVYSPLPSQIAERYPTVLSEDTGTTAYTYGYNTERISRKKWKAINIFVLDVEQKFIANKKWLQFSEAIGYDMSVERKKIGSKPNQFHKLLYEWLNVMKETERNPIPYLKWALEEVDEKDLVTQLTRKFGSTHDIHDEDMDQLQTELTSRDFSITVKPNTNVGHTIIQAATVVMGDRNVVTKVEGETKTAKRCDRQLTKQDLKKSQDYANNLSSNVVDCPCDTIDALVPLVEEEFYSAIVGRKCVIKFTIDEKYRPDHVIWRWKQNEEDDYSKIVHSEKYMDDPSLTIKTAERSDEGYYKCQVVHAAGSINSKDIFLEILGAKPKINLSFQSPVLRGRTSKIDCSITSKIPLKSIQWYLDDENISPTSYLFSGGTLEEPSLTLVKFSDCHVGKYRCEVSNDAGTVPSENVVIEIAAPPVISIPLKIEACEDQSVTITCLLKSEPPVQSVVWYKEVDGKKGAIDVNRVNYHGGNPSIPELTVIHTDKMDTGCYMCRASNSVGITFSGKCFLQILYKPVITVQSETNACDGELVNIDCKIDAKPDIYSLQWYRIIDGQLVELLQTSRNYKGGNTRHPVLSIINIAKNDEGTYICKASNSVGEGLSGECKLKVFFKPRVLVETSSISCSTGQTISLKCRIQADPAVKHIHWSKGEGFTKQRWKIIEKTENKAMERSIIPSFTIRNVQMSDSGHYVCEATNMVATTRSEPIILDVTTGITTKRKPIIQDITTDIPDSNTILLAYTADVDTVRTFKEHILEVLVEKNDIHADEFIIKDDVDREFLDTVDRAIQSAKIVFLLLSKDFVDKAWPNVLSMSNLTVSLYSRQSLIVPVYLEQSINLPIGLRSLMCLYFYRHDNAYKKALGKLMKGLL